jgi:hypothetical protein
MSEFDLTAARAARGNRESKTLVLRGEDGEIQAKYDLVPEFPAAALDAGTQGRLAEALRALFLRKEDAEEFMSQHHPSVDDLIAIMRGAYGTGGSPGESSASGS